MLISWQVLYMLNLLFAGLCPRTDLGYGHSDIQQPHPYTTTTSPNMQDDTSCLGPNSQARCRVISGCTGKLLRRNVSKCSISLSDSKGISRDINQPVKQHHSMEAKRHPCLTPLPVAVREQKPAAEYCMVMA